MQVKHSFCKQVQDKITDGGREITYQTQAFGRQEEYNRKYSPARENICHDHTVSRLVCGILEHQQDLRHKENTAQAKDEPLSRRQ